MTVVLTATTEAKPVTSQEARRAAATFLHIGEGTLREMPLQWNSMHLFTIDGGGFVLTSADSRVQPVLGYSLNGSSLRPDGELNESFVYWLEDYDAQIRAVVMDESAREHPQWSLLLAGTAPKAVYDTAVGPLIETKWGQEDYYNALCPVSSSGQKTLTGCVATSVGQVMRYWQWPDVGVGSHSYNCLIYGPQSADFGATSYDWNHMPVSLTALSDSTDVAAVATLLYHFGVAVDMVYGTLSQNGSGAFNVMDWDYDINTPCAENALRAYFKYSPALTGAWRANFTDAEWTALMKDEMDHRRPVVYAGFGPIGGHSFVLDGYDTNGFFSINWGYEGSCDGFFSLDNVAIDDASSFTLNQAAIVGIEPDTLYGSSFACTVTVTSADSSRGSVSGGGVYAYRDTVTLTATAVDGYRFHCWSNGAVANPYQFLAHDLNVQAIFKVSLLEDNDTLSYTGRDVSGKGLYSVNTANRMGIKIPADCLQGHNYLTAVDNFMHNHLVAVNIHFGGEDAPGPIVHSQQYRGTGEVFSWQRIVLDSAIAINADNNLWVVIQPMEDDIVYGAKNIDADDGNWFSTDNGATWDHLYEFDPPYTHCNPNLSWMIRCITSATVPPVGIEEVESPMVTLVTSDHTLTMDNPDGATVRLYDIMGRHLATSHFSPLTFHLSPFTFLPPASTWSKSTAVRHRRLLQSDNIYPL